MKLRELFESRNKSVGIIFGRFNPPHQGHKAAWNTASKFDEWYIGTNQSTQGPKDPLPFNVKIDAMKAIMPEIEGHLVAEQSWFTLASMVYKNHGAVTLHIVTDENDSKIFVPALQKSNGKEGPHGYYKFRDIVWEPAARISSATDLRAAVAADDRAAFERAAGVPADTRVAGRPFFDVVKHFLTPYLDQAAAKEAEKANKAKLKAEKEKAKPVKKTKEPEQGVAEGSEDSAEKYKAHLLKTAPRIMDFLAKTVKGWRPSEQEMLGAIDTAYTVMKHTGDVKQSGKAMMDELNTLHRMSQGQQGVAEGAPIVVAQAPIDIRNPKKAVQQYRNQGDIVPATKLPSAEKRGVKGRPGQSPMPKYDESVSETARMSAAAKLSKAWDQQQAKSAASRKRGQELLNPPKKEEPKPVSEKFHIFKRFKKTRK